MRRTSVGDRSSRRRHRCHLTACGRGGWVSRFGWTPEPIFDHAPVIVWKANHKMGEQICSRPPRRRARSCTGPWRAPGRSRPPSSPAAPCSARRRRPLQAASWSSPKRRALRATHGAAAALADEGGAERVAARGSNVPFSPDVVHGRRPPTCSGRRRGLHREVTRRGWGRTAVFVSCSAARRGRGDVESGARAADVGCGGVAFEALAPRLSELWLRFDPSHACHAMLWVRCTAHESHETCTPMYLPRRRH